MRNQKGSVPDWEDEKNYTPPVVSFLKIMALLLAVFIPIATYCYHIRTTKQEPAIKEAQLVREINNNEDIKIELRMINHRLAELEKEVFYLERKGN